MGQWASANTWLSTNAASLRARSWSLLLQALFFGLAYFAAAQLRDWLSLGPSHLPTFWLPAGLFVGVLLRVAPRRWPLFVAAAVVANILFNVAEQGRPVPVGLGYDVRAAAGPLEALEILRAGEPIDLLFSDVVMPNMSGVRLAEEARRLRPGLKVLLTSGYSRESLSPRTTPLPVIAKPYKASDLGAKIRVILDA